MKLIKKEHESLVTVMLLGCDHVLKHCTVEGAAKDLKEACRPHVPRRSSRPETLRNFLVSATESGILGISFVDPGIRVFVKEDSQISNMAETLEN